MEIFIRLYSVLLMQEKYYTFCRLIHLCCVRQPLFVVDNLVY